MNDLGSAAENVHESAACLGQPKPADSLVVIAPVLVDEGHAHISVTDSMEFEIPILKCSDTWTCWSCKKSGNTGRICSSCGVVG